MIKTAYNLGIQTALQTLGVKLAAPGTEDAEIEGSLSEQAEDQTASNPAEMLAQLFKADQDCAGRVSPDNKTKEDPADDPLDGSPKWGPQMTGTGMERLERMVPGFHLPPVSSI